MVLWISVDLIKNLYQQGCTIVYSNFSMGNVEVVTDRNSRWIEPPFPLFGGGFLVWQDNKIPVPTHPTVFSLGVVWPQRRLRKWYPQNGPQDQGDKNQENSISSGAKLGFLFQHTALLTVTDISTILKNCRLYMSLSRNRICTQKYKSLCN